MVATVSSVSLLDWLEYAKWFCVAVYVLSTIGVIVGVYWEGEHFDKAKQDKGWKLLLGSLSIDTFFSFLAV
jgi:hypothetical protein